ncbi:MAG TPA: glutamate--tRNA ligase family protein, partial [Methylophilaceae bacterium]|nr:glutamate--tRNA ligase family protein [Methylophilaceae bacterium]
DGQKLSKRHGAVSVMQYREDGYLPQAVLNYLARLGWSHGDDEIFSMAQFCQWFDLDHITPSAAQFNTEKLNWLNAHYLREVDLAPLAQETERRLTERGIAVDGGSDLTQAVALYRERASTLNDLAQSVSYFYVRPIPEPAAVDKHITPEIVPVLRTLTTRLELVEWTAEAIHAEIEQAVVGNQLKFPKIAMPLRVMLTGGAQSPSIDAVMAILGREETLARIHSQIG